MASILREWHFVLVDAHTGASIDDDSGQLLPLTAGSPSAPTIYTNPDGTTVANAVRNPRTFSNGRVRFWTDRSVQTLDLVVMTAIGQAYFLEDVPYSRHRILVNQADRQHTLVVPIGFSNNAEVDTGLDFPVANLIIKDAHLRVTAIDATETVDIGILSSEAGGDADGFLLVMDAGNLGYVNQWPVVTNGANIDYSVHTSGYGALLKQGIAGADAVATVGGFQRRYYRTDGVAKSISYTETAGGDTLAGYAYFEYFRAT